MNRAGSPRTRMFAVIAVSSDGFTNAPCGMTMLSRSSASATVFASVYTTRWPSGSAIVTGFACRTSMRASISSGAWRSGVTASPGPTTMPASRSTCAMVSGSIVDTTSRPFSVITNGIARRTTIETGAPALPCRLQARSMRAAKEHRSARSARRTRRPGRRCRAPPARRRPRRAPHRPCLPPSATSRVAVGDHGDVARPVDLQDERARRGFERKDAVSLAQVHARGAEDGVVAGLVGLDAHLAAVGHDRDVARLEDDVYKRARDEKRGEDGEVAAPPPVRRPGGAGSRRAAIARGRTRGRAQGVAASALLDYPHPGHQTSSSCCTRRCHQARRAESERKVVHLLSIRPLGVTTLTSSGSVTLRHPELTAYRCFLPDLTGFTALRRAGPSPQRRSAPPVSRYATLEQEFSPAIAACGYRAPLAPRLARPATILPHPFARQGSSKQWR